MKRIRLGNTVFEGLNNVYLLEGDGLALVDTGVAIPDVRAELADGLADHGYEFADVDAIYLTHWHPDHAGLAGEIQAESGADVFVHEADAPLVAGDEPTFLEDTGAQRRLFDAWGIPDGPRRELQSFIGNRMDDLVGRPADVTAFSDGESFEAPDRTLEAVHLPGHAAGLTAYAFDRDGGSGDGGSEAFVGDAVLPKYTPNVGGADTRVDAALAKYAESLVRVIERDWDRIHPGHRDAIDDPARRAAVILEHHRERTQRVVDVLAEHGPCDAWTVSEHLFGDLQRIHILHGPGEAFAHLDHLADAGVVGRDETDARREADAGDAIEYELLVPASDVDVDALFPDTRFKGRVEVDE